MVTTLGVPNNDITGFSVGSAFEKCGRQLALKKQQHFRPNLGKDKTTFDT
jgi:hypothetical protein